MGQIHADTLASLATLTRFCDANCRNPALPNLALIADVRSLGAEKLVRASGFPRARMAIISNALQARNM